MVALKTTNSGSLFSTSSPALIISCLFYHSLSSRGEVKSHCGFLICISLMIFLMIPTSNTDEAEVERFYEDLQDLLELTHKKDGLVIIGDWNAKLGSQENRQIWPWSKWSRAKANRVLPRECTGHGKHPLPTTQEKTLHMDITRWPTLKLDWLYSLQLKM